MFAGGRTKTIRSCSSESLEFSKALNDPSASVEHRFETMKRAIEGHKFYAAQAVSGFGVDRHLLGLKLVAKENGIPVPELFSDKAYAISTHFRLSTSQVSPKSKLIDYNINYSKYRNCKFFFFEFTTGSLCE